MHIRQFGIRLVRLKEEHIEMVRQWRNAQDIRAFMEYQDYITPPMQQKWFHSLDPLRDFYFVIEKESQPVGLIHTSAIDWEKKTGHSGLFIWKREFQGTQVPVLASLSMVDFFFSFCTLQKLYAKVNTNNPVALKYNAQLGFKPAESADGKLFCLYELTKNDYQKATKRLHQLAETIGDDIHEIAMDNSLFESLQSVHALNPKYSGGFVTLL